MTDTLAELAALRRPRLLIRAARHGQGDYNRNRHLRHIFRVDTLPSPDQALARLLPLEAEAEARRVAHDAAYSVTRHVELLIALMAESRLMEARIASDLRAEPRMRLQAA